MKKAFSFLALFLTVLLITTHGFSALAADAPDTQSAITLTEPRLGIKAKLPNEEAFKVLRLGAYEIVDGVDFEVADNLLGDFVFSLFNIMFIRNQTEVLEQLGSPAQIFLPIPEGYNAQKCAVFRITDGRAVETDFTLNGSELSFTVNGSGLFAIVDTSKKPQQVLPGDVNFDGKIRSDDARLVLRAVAKLETLTPFKELAADIDKNGKVNAADARKILRIYAKLE